MPADGLREARRRDFEQLVVYRTLRRGHVIGDLRKLKAERESHSGSRQLTLEWLRGRYPKFPLRLGAVLLPDHVEDGWADVFARFTNTLIFRSYKQWLDEQGIDDHKEHVGIVFNVGGTTFVLHNLAGAQAKGRSRLARAIGKPPVTLYIEEFEGLLRRIGSNWAIEQEKAQPRG